MQHKIIGILFFLTKNCLKNFIGFLLFTGFHTLPQEQLYWSEDEDISIDCVRKCFPRNRYLEIKRNLHFNDNNEILKEGNLRMSYKIQPLFDKLNANYVKFGVFSKNLRVDEQMVRYYGHLYLKQFIRGKTIKCLVTSSGYFAVVSRVTASIRICMRVKRRNNPQMRCILWEYQLFCRCLVTNTTQNHVFFATISLLALTW